MTTMEIKSLFSSLLAQKNVLGRGLGTPLLVLAALGMVVLPMPAFLLDILFTFNIALAMVVLFVENAQGSLQRSLTIDECKGEKECAFCKKSVENVCGIRFCGLSVSHSGCFSF
jgi:hypothetical protein